MPVFVKPHVRSGRAVSGYERRQQYLSKINTTVNSITKHITRRKMSPQRFKQLVGTRRKLTNMRRFSIMFGYKH